MCASVNNIHANVSNTRTINLERLVSLRMTERQKDRKKKDKKTKRQKDKKTKRQKDKKT
jgi:hypothetical protein